MGDTSARMRIDLLNRDAYSCQYFKVSNRYFSLTVTNNIFFFLFFYFKKENSVNIYNAEIARKCLHCVIIINSVLSNISMTFYLQPFARWQLCWCCLYQFNIVDRAVWTPAYAERASIMSDLWFSRRWLAGEKEWQHMRSGYCEEGEER